MVDQTIPGFRVDAHTKGPWIAHTSRVIKAAIKTKRWDGTPFEYLKEIAWTQPVGCDDRTRLANACLIAAAPELLEAITGLRELALHAAELDHPLIVAADRAIAKALPTSPEARHG